MSTPRMVHVEAMTLPGGCGVEYARHFDRNPWSESQAITELNGGGCGWLAAAFTYTPISQDAYLLMSKKYKLVFRTPDRVNTNSGNAFYFCIFDAREKP